MLFFGARFRIRGGVEQHSDGHYRPRIGTPSTSARRSRVLFFPPLISPWDFRKVPTSYTLCVITVSPGISVSCPVQRETSS